MQKKDASVLSTRHNTQQTNRLNYLANLINKSFFPQIPHHLQKQTSCLQIIGTVKKSQSSRLLNKQHNNVYHNQSNTYSNKKIKTQQNQKDGTKIQNLDNRFQNKKDSRLTFGPNQFPNQSKIDMISIYNPQNHIQIQQNKFDTNNSQKIHKQSNNSKLYLNSLNDKNELRNQKKIATRQQNCKNPILNPRIQQILTKQIGLNQNKINKMKIDHLNYELSKFIKCKGNQYLKQMRQKLSTIDSTNINKQKNEQRKIQTKVLQQNAKNMKKKEKSQKYINYIPQIFPRIKKRNSARKTALNEEPLKQIKKRRNKTKEDIKCSMLNQKQQMLGKIVFDKVEDYFKLDHERADYFLRVKSEKNIDQAWIQYLKTKIDRADLLLKKKQKTYL